MVYPRRRLNPRRKWLPICLKAQHMQTQDMALLRKKLPKAKMVRVNAYFLSRTTALVAGLWIPATRHARMLPVARMHPQELPLGGVPHRWMGQVRIKKLGFTPTAPPISRYMGQTQDMAPVKVGLAPLSQLENTKQKLIAPVKRS